MSIYISFYVGFNDEPTHYWKCDELSLEWTREGVMTSCNSNCYAFYSGKIRIPINPGSNNIIAWEKLIPDNCEFYDYSIKDGDRDVCCCRLFRYDDETWLRNRSPMHANPEIMHQSAECLEGIYLDNPSYDVIQLLDNESILEEWFDNAFPKGVDDECRKKILAIWRKRFIKAASSRFLNTNIDENSISRAYSVLVEVNAWEI